MCAHGARRMAVEQLGRPHPALNNYHLPRWRRRAANDNPTEARKVRGPALMVGGIALVCTFSLVMVLF